MSKFLSARDYLEGILEYADVRPEPLDVIRYTDAEIVAAAEALGHPVRELGDWRQVHEVAMPLLLAKCRALLACEVKNPLYCFFARDGAVLYDAMSALFQDTSILQRLRLIRYSMNQASSDEVSIGQREMLEEHRRVIAAIKSNPHTINLEQATRNQRAWTDMRMSRRHLALTYLQQEGISRSNFLEAGQDYVFVDSGYAGSMFLNILQLLELEFEDVESGFERFLVYKTCDSSSKTYGDQLPSVPPVHRISELVSHMEDVLIPFWLERGANLVDRTFYSGFSLQERTDWALCNWMQAAPKFCASSSAVIDVGGRLMGVPNPKRPPYVPSSDRQCPMSFMVRHPNYPEIDPVAAIRLQRMTLDYFSDPDLKRSMMES